jgi:hypothetical protein
METDLEYAQAAIDMLPGSVEEIDAFLRAQKILPRWKNGYCPIERWVGKWTGEENPAVGHLTIAGDIPTPTEVSAYMFWVDRGCP